MEDWEEVRLKGWVGWSLADNVVKAGFSSRGKAELLGVCTDMICSDMCFNPAMGEFTGKEQR